MKDALINRREFLRNLGVIGAGTLLSISPWLSVFSEVVETSSEKCHLAIIGTGSKGHFLMSFSLQNPKVEIVRHIQFSMEKALNLVRETKIYTEIIGKSWKIRPSMRYCS